MKVVRSSKFRNVFGTAPKKEHAYDGVKVSRSAWDSNKIKVNPKFVAVMWEAAGGGAVGVVPLEMHGKISPNLPLITGHKAEVLDIDFHPYNDNLLASASEDTYVKIWSLPEGGLKESMNTPAQTLSGHRRKVGSTDFNPVANNTLATSSADLEVKVWDIEKGAAMCSVAGHTDIVQSVAWSSDGALLVTGCKDKKMRLLDPRAGQVVHEVVAHEGSKGSRILFTNKNQRLVSVGFSKNSSRQYAVWDAKSMDKPIVSEDIDTSAGLIMPFYDQDLNILYLAGKGDGNIRYYEMVDDDKCIFFLSEFKSATPQRGLASMPKRGCDVSLNEVAKLYKVDGQGKLIEGISFQVPRKGDSFQDDIFPDCVSEEPAMSADQWKGGAVAEAKRRSMAPGFVQGKKPATSFAPQVVKEDDGPKNEKELREEYEKLKTRVAYLESEVVKRDARIKQLEAK